MGGEARCRCQDGTCSFSDDRTTEDIGVFHVLLASVVVANA